LAATTTSGGGCSGGGLGGSGGFRKKEDHRGVDWSVLDGLGHALSGFDRRKHDEDVQHNR
jgi:hypothetical protein